jgi:hypothetical protein
VAYSSAVQVRDLPSAIRSAGATFRAFYESLGVKPRTSKIFYRIGGEDLEESTRPIGGQAQD